MLRSASARCFGGVRHVGKQSSLLTIALPRSIRAAPHNWNHPLAPARLLSAGAAAAPTPARAAAAAPLVVRGGIVSRPLQWEELVAAIESNNWNGLGRLSATQQAYNDHKQRVLSEWTSMGDFILHNVFGVKRIQPLSSTQGKSFVKARGGMENSDPHAPDAAPCQVPSVPSAAAANSGSAHANPLLSPTLPFLTRWTPNSFPYGVVDGIDHQLLWVSQGHGIDAKMLRSEIDKKFPPTAFDTISFVNPIHNRSVKEVYHAHVFARRKEEHTHKHTHTQQQQQHTPLEASLNSQQRRQAA